MTMMTSMLVPAKAKLISGFHPKSLSLETTRKVKELMDGIAYEASDAQVRWHHTTKVRQPRPQ
jgi:hypothetical protein